MSNDEFCQARFVIPSFDEILVKEAVDMPVAKSRKKAPVPRKAALEETFVAPPEGESPVSPPWEEIEAGRYQPRRIRGSCRGRALG